MLKHLLILTALLLPTGYASAEDYRLGELTIANPWSMELPPNAPTVAAYFVIHNNGTTGDKLVSVDSPVAGLTQLHEHVHANGLMKMQQVPSVEVAAGGDTVFAPMGHHVMLLELQDKSRLTDGQTFPLTLHFEKSGEVTVQVPVMKQAPDAVKHSH